MNLILAIALIVAALILGVVIGAPKKKQNDNSFSKVDNNGPQATLSEADNKISKLTLEKQELLSKIAKLEQNDASKVSDIQKKYESLLSEAKSKCDQLDKQLKDALNGKVDNSLKSQLAEVEKLKKQISDLEDEIEDKEDDLSSLKKKMRSKDEELTNVQNSLQKEQKNSQKLQGELDSTKQTLKETREELDLKVSSLMFIQEILSAPETSTEDVQKLYRDINNFESFVKGQFMSLNAHLYESGYLSWNDKGGKAGFADKKAYFVNQFDQWAATRRKSWLDGKTTIALVGEFSAGKTSIVNRILSQDNPNIPKLPVSAKATTAIPTYIAGGQAVSYNFISGDGKSKKILEETFKKVSKEVLGQVKGVSALIKYFVMTYKNPNLNGLSILDTPGFNSNDKEDADRTIDVINECDALFWVFDVNAGTVNRSSLNLIKDKLNKPLYVVINKCDTKADSEVQKVENLIKKTFSDAGMQVMQYIRFSQNAPLDQIMNPIKSVKRNDARDTFVGDVGGDLEQVKSIMDNNVKEANKRYTSAQRKGDNITDKFIGSMQALQGDCNSAYSIPRWVEHFFRSDRYEMDASEGNRLKALLEQIAGDRVRDLAEKFDERVDQAAEIQQAYSDLCDFKAAFQKTDECYSEYKRIAKQLN